MSRTIMIMAGGTGGHIFPALAVARFMTKQGWNVVWLGAKDGMEAEIVSRSGYSMAWITFSGVRGRSPAALFLLPLKLLIAFWQSAKAIFAHRPDVVLGMGGYVAFPGGMMASFLNRPLVIHEQNSIAGLANRVLAKLADKVLVAFPHAFGEATLVILTGNPVRDGIAALLAPQARFQGRSGNLRLLVIGGSLGARALNETVPEALRLLPEHERPSVTHQSGAKHLEDLRARYQHAGVAAMVVPFVEDIAAAYAAADLVICRAGATTIAELACAGVASIVVPYPHAVDDHQTMNARFLSERGAAVLVPQNEFTPEMLTRLLAGLSRERLLEMAQRARDAGKPDATRAVAQVCMELAA